MEDWAKEPGKHMNVEQTPKKPSKAFQIFLQRVVVVIVSFSCNLDGCAVEEVWSHVEKEYEALKSVLPPNQCDGAIGQAYSKDKILSGLKLAPFQVRNVACNLCWTLPLFESLAGDHLSMDVVRKYAENKFYEKGKPRAPALWPGMSIPIACMQRDELPPKGTWKRYGGDIAVAAFWYAFAEVIKSNAPGPDLERFRLVARTAEENWGLVVLISPACRLFTVCHLSAQDYPFLFPFLPDRSRKVCSSNGVA